MHIGKATQMEEIIAPRF